jgi:hypothetical protein
MLVRTSLLTVFIGLSLGGQALAQQVSQQAVQVTSDPTAPVTGQAPTLATASINVTGSGPQGEPLVGDQLTAAYTVNDPDADPLDAAATNATIQWLADGAPVGTVGSTTYTIQPSDLGKTITYRIQLHTDQATTDPYQGVLTVSSSVGGGSGAGGSGEVAVTPPDDLLNVTVSGNPRVDDVLTATPTCVTTCGTVAYQWMVETAAGSGTYQDIAGATAATYTATREDQRRRIKVQVNK